MFPPPDRKSRLEILKIHSSEMPLGRFNLDDLVDRLENYTGADIEAICREAALIAMRAGRKSVSKSHFEDAINRVRPTVNKDMLDYYSKMEETLVSGLESVKRDSNTLQGIESV